MEEKVYHRNTAGYLMTSKVPVADKKDTVGDVERKIFKDIRSIDSLNYIYILSSDGILEGVISIKELFRREKQTIVKEIINKDLITVYPYTKKDRVAHLAVKQNLKAIPVVDESGVFLGAVTSDTILQTLDTRLKESIFRHSSILKTSVVDDLFKTPVSVSLKHRLPWLLLGLAGGMVVSVVVKNFEDTLSKNIILAAYIPLIVYMASAVGMQMAAFVIRAVAVETKINFYKYFIKQFVIVTQIGLISSIMLYLGSYLVYRQGDVSLVLAVALFFSILSSIITGLIIPYVFSKLRTDPANATGPVSTIIQDILSVLVYFFIASKLLL